MVIAGNNSGYESVMQGVGRLSLVNPRDPVEFARRMAVMLDEPEVQKIYREWSKEYVKKFAYPEIIGKYEALYKKAIKEHKS